MNLLDRKLVRDIAALRGQVITIALVVAAGVAVFVASVSTFYSLRSACESFYADTRFPQIFVTLKRAPLSIVARLSEIPGVVAVEPRIVRDVLVDWPASNLPVSARIVSITRAGDENLARLYLRSGVAPAPHDARDAAINEAFAEVNAVRPGADVRVLLNQRMQGFHITGIALSPEYVYAVKPGLPIPDDRYYAILWVDRSAAEAAFDMKGAFNDAIVSLAPGVDPKPVIAELDRLLEPYGSVGAIEQRDQTSNRFLQDELNQQKLMAITIPFIFFGISAFLLNVVLGRMVAAQREQIATLKALGFPTARLVLHYMKLVFIIVLIGSALGVAVGCGFGSAMIESYHGFFRLPVLAFELTPWSIFAGTAISLAAASFGVLSTLRTLVAMPPAIAMRPAAPLRFRRSLLEASLPRRLLTSRRIMIIRNIAGRPLRTGLTIVGIAFALPMVVLGLFWRDAIDHMIELQFNLVERGNVGVTFPHPLDRRIVGDLAREPGVLVVEGQRVVPVRLRAGHRTYLTSITGLPAGSELRRPHDVDLRPIDVRPDGVTFTRRLADRLGVELGDTVSIEVMEGRRLKRDLPVTAIADESIGMAAYMKSRQSQPLDGRRRGGFRCDDVCRAFGLAGAVAAVEGFAGNRVRLHQGRYTRFLSQQDRRSRVRDRRHYYRLCNHHCRWRRLQHSARQPAGACLGAGQPSRSGVYAHRSGAHPVGRIRGGDRGGNTVGCAGLARPCRLDCSVPFQRKLSDPGRNRTAHLSCSDGRRVGGGIDQRVRRASPHRSP